MSLEPKVTSDCVGELATKVLATAGWKAKDEVEVVGEKGGIDGTVDGTKVATAGWVLKRKGRRRAV